MREFFLSTVFPSSFVSVGWLALGLVLLLPPIRLLLKERITARSLGDLDQEVQDNDEYAGNWYRQPWVYFDMVRSLVGTKIFILGLTTGPFPEWKGLWQLVGWLTIALWLQTWSREDNEVMVAPIFFQAGMLLGILPPVVAALALLFAFSSLIVLRRLEAFFIAGTIGVLLIGTLFMSVRLHSSQPLAGGTWLRFLLAEPLRVRPGSYLGGVTWLLLSPWLVSLIFHRDLRLFAPQMLGPDVGKIAKTD